VITKFELSSQAEFENCKKRETMRLSSKDSLFVLLK